MTRVFGMAAAGLVMLGMLVDSARAGGASRNPAVRVCAEAGPWSSPSVSALLRHAASYLKPCPGLRPGQRRDEKEQREKRQPYAGDGVQIAQNSASAARQVWDKGRRQGPLERGHQR